MHKIERTALRQIKTGQYPPAYRNKS